MKPTKTRRLTATLATALVMSGLLVAGPARADDPTSPNPPALVDTDDDLLTDEEEISLGTDPLNPDTDGDGLHDGIEVNVHQTNPLLSDTDGDYAPDGYEVDHGTDPLDPRSVTSVTARATVTRVASATGSGYASAQARQTVTRGVVRDTASKRVRHRGKWVTVAAAAIAPLKVTAIATNTQRLTRTATASATVTANCAAPTYDLAYECAVDNGIALASRNAAITAATNASRAAQARSKEVAAVNARKAATQKARRVRIPATTRSKARALAHRRALVELRRKINTLI